MAARCLADGPDKKMANAMAGHQHAHAYTHIRRERKLCHPCEGRIMPFLNIDDSIFSPMVQHFYSRRELKLKKKIVSGKLTNVLDAQGLVSRMKASF